MMVASSDVVGLPDAFCLQNVMVYPMLPTVVGVLVMAVFTGSRKQCDGVRRLAGRGCGAMTPV